LNALVNYKTVLKPSLPAKLQTTDYLDILIGCFSLCMEKNTLIFKTDWNECFSSFKTDLTKILNPKPNPKPKTTPSFRLHLDLAHQSFPSSTKGRENTYKNLY